jgi:hypothetical protein
VIAFGSPDARGDIPPVSYLIQENPGEGPARQVYPVGHGMYELREESQPAQTLRDYRKNHPR